ncbi:uncharacterized protein [Nerophis lumbriciformis]|uniref:uncharacterized protein n=1 Tax=Nerophis lumbriciformis TaxID=546530 RepID=UPI003BAD10D1
MIWSAEQLGEMSGTRSGVLAWGVMVVVCSCCWSAANSAPLACDQLVRPSDAVDPRLSSGRWAWVSAGFREPAQLENFKLRDSASIDVLVSPSGNISYTTKIHREGKCHSYLHNVTLEGSTLTYDEREMANVTVTFLRTSCADCLVMRFDTGGAAMQAYLFSRRRVLTEEEKEEFRAQVECLNMPAPAWLHPSKELCPEGAAESTQALEMWSC